MKIDRLVVGTLEENCYIVSKDNNCIIIDPGDQFNKIKNFINYNKFNVVAIFVTHYHFDHIGALDECKKEYDVDVYDYSKYINDDKIYEIENFKFKIIDSRGHKEDLVSFYFYEDNAMFTGDFIFKDTIGRCDLMGGDYNMMIHNLKKFNENYDNINIYPGHGDNIVFRKNDNKYIRFIDNKNT